MLKKKRFTKVHTLILGTGIILTVLIVVGYYRGRSKFAIGSVCNTRPAMATGFFHKRCSCLGEIVENRPPPIVDPMYFTDYCKGIVTRRYYVFDTNWPAVMEEIDVREVGSYKEALDICNQAVMVVNKIYSKEYGEEFSKNCLQKAEDLFQ